jgi:hypothetical protein
MESRGEHTFTLEICQNDVCAWGRKLEQTPDLEKPIDRE